MKIESPVLGAVEIAEDKLIDFPAGLPGFEHCRRFALVHDEAATPGLFMLHSIDEPTLLFSVTGPENLGVTYEFSLSEEEVALLRLDTPSDALVAIIIRKDDDAATSPASIGMRANFMAPLVINAAARLGMQKVINKLGCEVTLRSLS